MAGIVGRLGVVRGRGQHPVPAQVGVDRRGRVGWGVFHRRCDRADGRQGEHVHLRQRPVERGDVAGPHVVGLGINAAVVVAPRQLGHQVVQLGARLHHVAVRAPHPVNGRDDGGRVVGPGADPEEPGVVDRPRALQHQCGIDTIHLPVLRDGDARHLRAQPLQYGHGLQHARRDAGLDRLGKSFFEDADPQPVHATVEVGQDIHALRDVTGLTGIVAVRAGHCLQRRRCVRHVARHRADMVHAGLGREADREMRHEAKGRLQPDHAAIGRGQPDGPALVAAERDVHLTGRQRRAGAGGRSTRHAAGVVRVQRLAVVAHEPVHHMLADHPAAGFQHAGDDGRVHVRDEALHRLGGEHLRDAGHADVVLEADRLARQQPGCLAAERALPQPGLERVLVQGWPVAGRTLRKQARRRLLLRAGLHEQVQLAHHVVHERHIHLRLGRVEAEAHLVRQFDELGRVRVGVHYRLAFAG